MSIFSLFKKTPVMLVNVLGSIAILVDDGTREIQISYFVVPVQESLGYSKRSNAKLL